MLRCLSMIEVSVIIPTWNREKTLPRALRSVLAQEGVAFEVMVVDDGSTDRTCRMITQEFPSVDYLFQPNQGPASARNRGVEHAHGEWIVFLDSDDEWRPGKLRAQLDFFLQNPECQICQTEEIWIRHGQRVNPMKKHKKYGGWIYEQCLPLCIISPSAVMMHRSVFDEVGLFDESLPACEDYDLWLRVAAKFPVGLISRAYVIKYGGHPDQRSHQFPAMDRFRIQSLAKILGTRILTANQAKATAQMLRTKADIYIRGALKRGKKEEAERVRNLIRENDTFDRHPRKSQRGDEGPRQQHFTSRQVCAGFLQPAGNRQGSRGSARAWARAQPAGNRQGSRGSARAWARAQPAGNRQGSRGSARAWARAQPSQQSVEGEVLPGGS